MAARDGETALIPTPELTAHAKTLLEHLRSGSARFVLRDEASGDSVELGAAIDDVLRHILAGMSQSRAIQILPHDLELTTVQAAAFLKVSRPFLIKLIDENKLPCRMVGTHRRIRLQDLIRYRAPDLAERRAALDEITKDAEKHGWGY